VSSSDRNPFEVKSEDKVTHNIILVTMNSNTIENIENLILGATKDQAQKDNTPLLIRVRNEATKEYETIPEFSYKVRKAYYFIYGRQADDTWKITPVAPTPKERLCLSELDSSKKIEGSCYETSAFKPPTYRVDDRARTLNRCELNSNLVLCGIIARGHFSQTLASRLSMSSPRPSLVSLLSRESVCSPDEVASPRGSVTSQSSSRPPSPSRGSVSQHTFIGRSRGPYLPGDLTHTRDSSVSRRSLSRTSSRHSLTSSRASLDMGAATPATPPSLPRTRSLGRIRELVKKFEIKPKVEENKKEGESPPISTPTNSRKM
jgi:hypothetical protein